MSLLLEFARNEFVTAQVFIIYFAAFDLTSNLTTNDRALHPSLPPNITHIGRTIFQVNVVDTMPEFMAPSNSSPSSIQSAVGFATVVLQVTGQDKQKFYVLVSVINHYLCCLSSDLTASL